MRRKVSVHRNHVGNDFFSLGDEPVYISPWRAIVDEFANQLRVGDDPRARDD